MTANDTECVRCGATDDREHGVLVGLVGELNEAVCNVCRTDELRTETVLKRREAEVYAFKEGQGMTHQNIAEFLGIEKSTVDEYSRRINDRRRRARGTIEQLENR